MVSNEGEWKVQQNNSANGVTYASEDMARDICLLIYDRQIAFSIAIGVQQCKQIFTSSIFHFFCNLRSLRDQDENCEKCC